MISQSNSLTVDRLDNGVAELTFDLQGESVNKFNQATVDDLGAALDAIEADTSITGLLVSSAKPVFIVGADITEFTALFDAGADTIKHFTGLNNANFNRLESLPFPTAVAINGYALGGGFEICLACDFRVMSTAAKVGLPETKLGIVPGWGGTVRLPRLIGIDEALMWVAGARDQKAAAALKVGAVDAIAEPDALRDVTLITLQHENSRAVKKANEAATAKSDFLANMSHELRTPLNAIIGFSEMMSSQLLGPLGNKQYHEYSHDIHTSARHLLSVINDILDVAKIEAGKLELLEDATDPLKLAVSVQRLMIERAENAGLKLKLSLPSKLPLIYADQRKLKQVLINLLANSVKFTPSGGTVELAGGVNDVGDFEFVVMDTGIGMSEEDIPKAFEPFAQIDSTLSRQFDGTGLGLPLAQGLIRLHGGELEMTSDPGKGTSVKCVLPGSRILPS